MNLPTLVTVLFLSVLGNVMALSSSGCGKQATLTNGNYTVTINGTDRAYVVRVPPNYDTNTQYRLIFQFHWRTGSAGQIINGTMTAPYYGIPPLDSDSAIYVVPEGLDEGGYQGWRNTGDRDVFFTDAMLSAVEEGLCVDQNLVFSMGHSYGAGMSHALACARPNVFRGVVLSSGALISGCSGGNGSVAVYQQHAINDDVLPIEDGRAIRDRFVRNNGCTPLATEPQPPPQGGHTTTKYQGCIADKPMTWIVHDGGHHWDPVDPGASVSWTPEAAWDFITQFA